MLYGPPALYPSNLFLKTQPISHNILHNLWKLIENRGQKLYGPTILDIYHCNKGRWCPRFSLQDF